MTPEIYACRAFARWAFLIAVVANYFALSSVLSAA
jgi:hypothetical protein